jgi:hypothetical protein
LEAAGKTARPLWRILVYGSLSLGTIAFGLVLRLMPLGLPWWVVKWGGSVLWAVMVYFILASILVRRDARTVALAASVIAGLVESIRLFHAPGLEAFRATLKGKLLLGRVFAWSHFAVYWAAIGLAALADLHWIRRRVPYAARLND